MTWRVVTLEDLFDIGSSKRVLQSQWQSEGVPFYRGREITRLAMDGFVENDLFISEEMYCEYSDRYGVPVADDIMVTAIGTIGNSYIVRGDDRFYFKDASVLWLKKRSDVDSRFVNYWLKSHHMRRQLDSGNGATVDTLTIQKLKSLRIAVPPTAEQQRIIATLDEAFEGIAKAAANAERNLANSMDLPNACLERHLAHQPGWREVTLAEIAEFKNGLNFTRASRGETLKIVGVKDFRNDYWVPSNDLEAVTIDGVLPPSYELRPNDILTVRSNGNKQLIGRCIIARDLPEKTSHSGFTIRIRVKTDAVLPEFLAYVLKRQSTRKRLVASGSGANISSLNQQALTSLPVAFPDVGVQGEILDKIHRVLGLVQEESQLRRTILERVHELKSSLLNKAFSGQLTGKETMAA